MVAKKHHESIVFKAFFFQALEDFADALVEDFDAGEIVGPVGSSDWVLGVVRGNGGVGISLRAFDELAVWFFELYLGKERLTFFALRPIRAIEKGFLIVGKVEVSFGELVLGRLDTFAIGDEVSGLPENIGERWGVLAQFGRDARDVMVAADGCLIVTSDEGRSGSRANW